MSHSEDRYRSLSMSLHASFVRNALTPLALWRRGERRQLSYQREFDRTQYLLTDELRSLQWTRMQAILTHAYTRCPFYRRRFDEAGIAPGDIRSLDDVTRLPILEKRDIQQHGHEMIADGWPISDLIRNQTGGSTG